MRHARWFVGAGALALFGGVAACSSDSGTDPYVNTGGAGGGGNGGNGGSGAIPGKSVGESCGSDGECRRGLACTSGACAYGASAGEGEPCIASGECAAGLQCVLQPQGARCTKEGSGVAGDGCSTDADCARGLRCGFVGLSLACTPEGTADVGQSCSTAKDCAAGLGCTPGASGSTCTPNLPGVPSFGVPSYTGVTCDPPSTGVVRAYFEVPGAAGGQPGDYFRLPFPNDALVKNGKIDLSGFPTPGVALLGFDPVKRYADAISATQSGWGGYGTVTFRFSGEVDYLSFRGDGAVAWVDVTEGTPEYGSSEGAFWYASGGRTKYVCENWLALRRPTGRPMLSGHTYAVWLAKPGAGVGGATLEVSPHLTAVLGSSAPSDPELARIHALYAPLRNYLGRESIPTTDLLTATVFTVGKLQDPMTELAAAVETAPAPTARGWVKCAAGVASPCPDATGERACGAGDPAYDEYHALVKLPVFQQGAAPYLEAPAGRIQTNAPVREEDVCLALTVPKSAAPASGYPVAVFAHGTGGHFRSHVNASIAGALAQASTPSGAVGIAVLGIDQVQHGPRRGGSTQSPNELFFNFANPDAAVGNPLQGAVDQLALARFASTLALSATDTGGAAIAFDENAISFFGHSQGSTEGSLAVPYTDRYRAAVLSGNGASLLYSLLTKSKPVNIAAGIPVVLQDFDAQFKLAGGEYHPVLSLMQQWVDVADPLNHAAAIARRAPTGRTPKHVFQTYGLGDTFSTPITMATYAAALGGVQVRPDASVTTPDTIEGVPVSAAVPVSGNLSIGGRSYTLAVRQYTPPSGRDGHFVAFDVANANADVARFLGMASRGTVPAAGN